MYHYVRYIKHSRYKEIKGLENDLFVEQILYLKKNYNIISIKDVILAMDAEVNLPNNACVLTFDDGYKDHFDFVFPILNKYKLKGAFYPPAKAFMDREVLQVNKIHFILASVGYNNIGILLEDVFKELDLYREQYLLETNEYYFKKLAKKNIFDTKEIIFFKRLLQVELEKELREKIINKLFRKFVSEDEVAFANELYMNKSQLECLINNNMHIGSHGYQHDWLNSMNSKEQELEITKSIEFLNLLGIKDNYTMCYPYGGHNETTMELLKKYNFKLGLTTMFDVADINENNKFQLRRLDTNHLPKKCDYIAEDSEWFQKSKI